LATAVLLLAAPLSGVASAGASVTMSASAPAMTFGETVTLAGTVTGDPACVAGRTVDLAWQANGSTTWTAVATTATGSDGTFAFTNGQQFTGLFEAQLRPAGSCTAASSEPVAVSVRVFLDTSLLAGSLDAGSCVDVDVQVSPAKPEQTVELQRRSAGAWTTVETLTLDAASAARASPCFGWEDVGIVRLRVVWTPQDTLNARGAGIDLAFRIGESAWMRAIDEAIGRRSVSVDVANAGQTLYAHAPNTMRRPASNEKLLLSMALLDRFGADLRIPTIAAASDVRAGVVRGNLWILGRGDPEVRASRLGALAAQLKRAGISKIRGRVMGARTYFRHDWWARGWQPGWRRYVALPSALTFDHNVVDGRLIRNPEARAAAALTAQLDRRGISVRGRPGAGAPPSNTTALAQVGSRPLSALLTAMDRPSDNYYAEVLGKALAADRSGPPGTIGKAAAAIESFADAHGADFSLYDSSGLSYSDRVNASGIVNLLAYAETTPWGTNLRHALPRGGHGTLEDRLRDTRVRAKTGTLNRVSALSGWVWLEREHRWVAFSILSGGMSKDASVRIEDAIARILSRRATLG
jgi:D-alanyl-D-alanine carboxypeptidase/D-alanyl-D-alanine-endopeptidase (penicillin-binding protein 4)